MKAKGYLNLVSPVIIKLYTYNPNNKQDKETDKHIGLMHLHRSHPSEGEEQTTVSCTDVVWWKLSHCNTTHLYYCTVTKVRHR